jgi:hypothetical protein
MRDERYLISAGKGILLSTNGLLSDRKHIGLEKCNISV